MDYRPVKRAPQGRFGSLTPLIDQRIEVLMDEIAVRKTEISRLESEKAKFLEAHEQRKVLCIDHYRKPAPKTVTPPPKRAA